MNRDKPVGQQAADEHNSKVSLRQKAEAQFRKREDLSQEKLDSLSPETLRASLYELRVHQIELEMQNEDLRRAQTDLDASRARYFDLYDLAPVGYCTVSEKGLILEANLTAATLLRRERDTLVGRRLSAFISKEDQELYYWCRKKLFDTRQPQQCDLRMARHDGTAFFAHLEVTAAKDEADAPVGHVALIDVTARKQAEDALREREAQMRSITESAQDAIIMMDHGGLISYWNPAAEAIFGYRREEALGRNLHGLLVPEPYHSAYRAAHPEFQRTGQGSAVGKTLEMAAIRKDGKEIAVSLSISAVALGGEWHSVGVVRDISERKRGEETLRASEARYAHLAEQSSVVAWEVDAQGLYTYVSQVAGRVWGYRPGELVGRKHFYDLHPESGREAFKASAFTAFARKQPFVDLVNAIQTKDGRQLWVSTNGSPNMNAEGTLCGYRGSDTDITERKVAQDALREAHLELEERVKNRTEELKRSNAQLQLLLDSTAEAIYGIDTHGDCTFCNPACLRMLGYEREDELLGKNMHWQIHQKHADGTRFPVEECRIFRAFQANEASHVDDEVLWRADGTSFPAEYWSYPQRIDGVAVGAVVTFIDITERKRAEAVVLQNVARAEELARLKSRFVSMASHELRTPLANIMIACELLKNFGTSMPARRSRSILADLMTGVASMVQTINDLLLAGKIEEGKLGFTPTSFLLPDFLRRCCLEVQPDLTLPSRIEIAFRDGALNVTADERLLLHILKNLLENALKYSPPDTKVELRVEAGPDSLTLSVRDRGIGVPEAEKQFLFDAFSRASNVGDRPGSGLGLFVAQKCAQAHGGQLRYASQPDGSVFSITIPLAATTDLNPDANPDG